jgi:hypothetical protein
MLRQTGRPAAEPTRPPSEAVRHLTQLDLARRWRISPRTLERWRWLRQGPAYLKLGAAIAYRLEDVEAFEAKRRHPAAANGQPNARGCV